MIMLPMLLAIAALQEVPVPREVHVFHDWAVACDNGRHCQALALDAEAPTEDYNGVLVIERGPEAEAPLQLRLYRVDGTPARLAVYGEALPARLIAAEGDFRIELQDRGVFIDRTLYADEIELQDARGAVIGRISVKGLRWAMLYRDEAQGRLHTRSALIRTGRRPASDVPAAPPVPEVRIAPATSEAALAIPASRLAALRRDTGCTIEEMGGPDEVVIAALGGGRTLVLLACGSGAYNVSMVPFVATREGRSIRIEPAPFDVPLDENEEAEGRRYLINATWDSASRTIEDFYKGRGLGDCGNRSRYAWDGERFRLVNREEMPECRGSSVYLTTWRAAVRP